MLLRGQTCLEKLPNVFCLIRKLKLHRIFTFLGKGELEYTADEEDLKKYDSVKQHRTSQDKDSVRLFIAEYQLEIFKNK